MQRNGRFPVFLTDVENFLFALRAARGPSIGTVNYYHGSLHWEMWAEVTIQGLPLLLSQSLYISYRKMLHSRVHCSTVGRCTTWASPSVQVELQNKGPLALDRRKEVTLLLGPGVHNLVSMPNVPTTLHTHLWAIFAPQIHLDSNPLRNMWSQVRKLECRWNPDRPGALDRSARRVAPAAKRRCRYRGKTLAVLPRTLQRMENDFRTSQVKIDLLHLYPKPVRWSNTHVKPVPRSKTRVLCPCAGQTPVNPVRPSLIHLITAHTSFVAGCIKEMSGQESERPYLVIRPFVREKRYLEKQKVPRQYWSHKSMEMNRI